MRGMPFDFQHKGVLQGGGELGGFWTSTCKKRKGLEISEPRSVLDSHRSPSPPTSSSALSSSLGGSGGSSDTAGVAAVSGDSPATHKWSTTSADDAPWASDLQPISSDPGGDKCGMAGEDWEAMLSAAPPPPAAASPTEEQTFLQWIMEDPTNSATLTHHDFGGGGGGAANQGFGAMDPGFVIDPIAAMGGAATSASPSSFGMPTMKPQAQAQNYGFPQLPLYMPAYQESMEEKHLLFSPGLYLNQHQQQSHPSPNPTFYLPVSPFAVVEPTCQIATKSPFNQQGFPQLNPAPPYHLQQRQLKLKAGGDEVGSQQQQAMVDQLFKAAELIEAGNPVSARGILARLNHQLPSPVGKPLHRSAFYFKEALHHIINTTSTHHPPPATPLDVVLKLGTYKAFSDVSPVLQFTNFTCIQALLEELGGADRIHIIDFDIAVGGQWSSFMQELAQRRCSSNGATTPLLKITAFASPNSHHPLELYLTRENLSHFASDLNIPFEFNVLSLDPFDPSLLLNMCAGADEAIAVNLPVGCAYYPPVPSLLRMVKQLSPKIIVSVDNGCDRNDLSFSYQFLHAFQSCTVLLDSIDAAGTNLEVSNKIERFLLQPRIENALMGRHSAGEKMLPWRTLFASAGFSPLQFSNFAETQAECLLKKVQVRGFHVEKRHSSLFLCWQRGELVSVSAWRC